MFQTQLEGCLTFVAKFVFTTTSMGRKLCIYNLGKKIQSLFVHSKCKKNFYIQRCLVVCFPGEKAPL